MKPITINSGEITFASTTGKVLSSNKNLETRVSGSGGGTNHNGYTSAVQISSTTVVHDHIFVEDQHGREHSFQLQDFNLSCREGNRLTIIAAFKAKKKSGPYIAAINHSTDKIFYNEDSLKEIARPSVWLLVLAIALVTIFSVKSAGIGGLIFAAIFSLGLWLAYNFYTRKNIKLIKQSIDPSQFLSF